jgi:hypothetical protein
MAVNRDFWRLEFTAFSAWLCPACQSGNLAIDADTLKVVETGPSKREHEIDAWEPEWIIERFVGLLACQNAECGQLVAIGGRTRHELYQDYETGDQALLQFFEPAFINPAPPIFPIPKECPEVVTKELTNAFGLYWSDRGSSANRLRAATEALLTHRRVPRTKINKHRKRVRISLHDRIEIFKNKDSQSSEYLIAIKWLGNAGSHYGLDELSGDDLLDGFELFEHVVERVYQSPERRLKKIAKGINARKGRPAKRRWR